LRAASLKKAVMRADASSVESLAHALKGSSASMGACGMVSICEKLEAAGNARDLKYTLGLLDHLEAEFERVRRALEEENKKYGAQKP
jgi:HPt (histidine-containing phosphotransfer) domain-containing protein